MRAIEILRRLKRGPIAIEVGSPIREVVALMVEHRIGCLPVLQGPRLVGIVSERDVLREAARDAPGDYRERKVEEVMTRDVVCARPEQSIKELMKLMTYNGIRHLPVVEGGRMEGLLAVGDVMQAFLNEVTQENQQLREYIQQPR